MKVYSDVEAGQNLPVLLEEAQKEGAVAIRRHDRRTFVIAPDNRTASPLDVPGVQPWPDGCGNRCLCPRKSPRTVRLKAARGTPEE